MRKNSSQTNSKIFPMNKIEINFPRFFCFAVILIGAGLNIGATEMVYTPVNPSFGGNPNNAPGLLNIAQVQNGFKAPAKEPVVPKTALENFNTYLQSLILNRLAAETMTTLFGTKSGLPDEPKTYEAAGFTVKITPDGLGNLTILTTDKKTFATAEFTISNTGEL
jgi:curli production assembly/transport component CsgF